MADPTMWILSTKLIIKMNLQKDNFINRNLLSWNFNNPRFISENCQKVALKDQIVNFKSRNVFRSLIIVYMALY